MLLAVLVAGCGSSSSSGQPKPTGLKKRVLITNQQSNTINLLDAQKDVFTSKNFGATSPTRIITAGGQTLVLDSTLADLTIIDNTKEQVTATAVLEDVPFDIAMTADGKTAFAAERNLGAVQFASTADGSVSPQLIPIPAPRRLVMSPNGSKLLVFPDPQRQTNGQAFYVVDVASKGLAIVQSPNLDQPITAVFGSSDNQAFVLNCGAECGGTAAGVVSVDFSGVFSTPAVPATVSTPVAVPGGATVGLLNGSTLYVAGSAAPTTGPGAACPLSRCGAVTVINTTSLTVSSSLPITDGLHQKMALANGRVYIGAGGCTVDPGTAANTVRGCLSIFNTGTPGVKFPQESSFRQNFDVTGLQPISGRNVIYIVQGGELDIFDTTTDALATGITQLDLVGKAADVVQIDP
jgi:hypothetical protein